MMDRIEAIYENGVFRPLTEVGIGEGERVELTVLPRKIKDPAFDLTEIAVETGLSDLATNIDYYLYGLPKHSDG